MLRNFLIKINKNFSAGFTLTELLVVISIVAIISGMFISYNRGSEKQLILFKEQQKIASAIQKTRDMSLSAYGGENVPCGYGVHIEMPNIIVIFKSMPILTNPKCLSLAQIGKIYNTATNDLAQPCGSPLNSDCVEKIYLDKDVQFDGATNLADVIFIPPDPLVFINNNATLYESTVALEISGVSGIKNIKVTKAGQITSD